MQTNSFKILFKTKGGHKEGMGDVTSSISLAQEFRKTSSKISFITNNNKNVIDLVSLHEFNNCVAESYTEIDNCLSEQEFDIAIMNQLNTPKDKGLLIKKSTKMLVTIEDTGESAKIADLRFNILYPIEDSFTDFKYIPLNQIYQKKHDSIKEINKNVHKILVTQGGSDTYGLTPKIIQALSVIEPDINIDVVLGPNFSHKSELNRVLNSTERNFNIIKDCKDLSNLMMQSDLAISAGGNTLFEMACLGVPTVVVCGESFEVQTAARLQSEGYGINLGFGDTVSEKKIMQATTKLIDNIALRKNMSTKGKRLIDGQGTKRLVETIIMYRQDH